MKKQNIVFVGFRGAGKSRFGRAFAEETGLPFADLDAEVEFILGQPILEFVQAHGWQVFREVEQRVTHDFSRNFSGIIATGGGTIENSKNLQNLKKNSGFVFLNPQFSDIKKYLLGEEVRGNYQRVNPSMPLAQELDQLWAQRKDIYAATAEHEVNPDFKGDANQEARKMLDVLPASILPKAPPKRRVAVFASRNGSTLQGLIEAQEKGRIPNVEFVLFVSDNEKAGAIKKAKGHFTAVEVLPAEKETSREEYDRALINLLREHKPDLILLAGWMRILSPLYCEQFGEQTYNVHPSLLPEYAGLMGDDVHSAVLDAGEKYTGCTIHRVSADVDAGETVLQRKVIVDDNDTVESLRKKVQKQEILGFCEALERR
ncbi:MAG: phosphoribosylglycinamide formyltransferase [Candidatus Gracilibacteria bacterium]|nr:phosphoribosylglycinamide formyltransferase [Candidatus Gracilibacteria bacterium]